MPRRTRSLLLLALGLASALHCAGATEFWVSPTGNDSAPGTREQPLASAGIALRRARDLRRVSPERAEGGVAILFTAGRHTLSEPILMRSGDSGTPTSPLVLGSAPEGRAVLSGGRVIREWIRPEQPQPRLPAKAAGKVWVAECRGPGGEPLAVRQLWVGEGRAQRARHPNAPEMARLQDWRPATREAGIRADDFPSPAEMRGVEMFVMQQWEIAHLRLAAVRREGPLALLRFQEPESRIEFEHPWPQPIMPPAGAGAFMLVGAPEFLDTPGEWAQEPGTGRLLYWPREGEDLLRDGAVVPVLERLLDVEGTLDAPVHDVIVRGLGFAHSAWDRPSLQGHVPLQAGMYLIDGYGIDPKGTPDNPTLDNQAWVGRPGAALRLAGVENVALERCSVSHTAMSGLDVVCAARALRIEGNRFTDIGGNAVQAGSFQDGPVETHIPYNPSDERELVRGVRIANNLVSDAANEDWGCVGIIAGYVRDTEIVNNEVRDVSYTAISLGWGWTRTLNCMRNNTVRANLLHRYATRMCDTAGVYTLSAQPGTVVTGNVVRDVRISPWVDRPDHWFYLYTDEGSSFITVRDNWTEAEKHLQNANGPNNLWENNSPKVDDAIRRAAGIQPQWRPSDNP